MTKAANPLSSLYSNLSDSSPRIKPKKHHLSFLIDIEKGGSIIIASECSQGIPEESQFLGIRKIKVGIRWGQRHFQPIQQKRGLRFSPSLTPCFLYGVGGRNRTGTELPPEDFEYSSSRIFIFVKSATYIYCFTFFCQKYAVEF